MLYPPKSKVDRTDCQDIPHPVFSNRDIVCFSVSPEHENENNELPRLISNPQPSHSRTQYPTILYRIITNTQTETRYNHFSHIEISKTIHIQLLLAFIRRACYKRRTLTPLCRFESLLSSDHRTTPIVSYIEFRNVLTVVEV